MGVDEYFASDAADDLRHDEETSDAPDSEQDDYAGDRQQAMRDQMADIRRELAPIPGAGPLLEQPSGKKLFATIHRDVKRQDTLIESRASKWKHYKYVAEGSQFSTLEKSEDQSVWKQAFPPGIDANPQPIPNKVGTLKRKIIQQVTTDPFRPNPKPDGASSDRNRGAADLMKKYLRNNAQPSAMHEQGMMLRLLDINMVGGSSFAWTWIDKMGGGWKPKQVKAHPLAEDATNPLVGPKLDESDQPVQFAAADGTTTIVTERTTSPIMRYVTDDGQFTKNPSEAARMWMPKHRRRVLGPTSVITHPQTSMVREARALTIMAWTSLDEAKDLFPILHTLNKAQLQNLCRWRPKHWKTLVPDIIRRKGGNLEMGDESELSGETLFFWYHRYCRSNGEYPDGGEVAVNGGLGGFLLRRDTLRRDVELEDGTMVPVQMNPPVAQYMAWESDDDPSHGEAGIALWVGSNELRAFLLMQVIDNVEKKNNPIPFIPSTSPVTKADMLRRDGTPVEILTSEDKPTFDNHPDISSYTPQLIENIDRDMNAEAGMSETANGLDSQYAASGVAKDISIKQSRLALAPLWQNTVAGQLAFWTNVGQQAQAELTVPQEVMLAGTESAFKQRYFVGGDLVGAGTMTLDVGTGTMMGPIEKVNLAAGMKNAEFLDADEAAELARSNMTDDLGLATSPHEENIDREVGEWIEGPDDQWYADHDANVAAQQQYQMQVQQLAQSTAQGMTQQAALSGVQLPPDQAMQASMAQAQQQVPPPVLKPLFNPFAPRPNYAEPNVAKVRLKKLTRVVSSPDFTKHKPSWQKCLKDAYDTAFYDAGGVTVRQRAEAAQAQQQAAQNAAQQTANATAQAKDASGAAASADNARAEQTKAAEATAARDHASAESAAQREHDAGQASAERESRLFGDVFQAALQAHTKGREVEQRFESQKKVPQFA